MPWDAALIGRAARLSGRRSCCAQRQPAFFSSIMHTITRQRLFTEIALAAGICLVAAAFFIAGCGRPDSDSTASSSPSAGADAKATAVVLRADPNPVPAGDGTGTTTVTWQTGDQSVGEVYVWDGTGERLFARGSQGSSVAPWIGTGSTEFRLYNSQDHGKALARLVVTRPPASAASATPASSANP